MIDLNKGRVGMRLMDISNKFFDKGIMIENKDI